MSAFLCYHYYLCQVFQQCGITTQTNNSLFFINNVVQDKPLTNYLLNYSTYFSKMSYNRTQCVLYNGTIIIYIWLFNNAVFPHKPMIHNSSLIMKYRIYLSLTICSTSQYIFQRRLLLELSVYFTIVPSLFMLGYSTMLYYLTNQ